MKHLSQWSLVYHAVHLVHDCLHSCNAVTAQLQMQLCLHLQIILSLLAELHLTPCLLCLHLLLLAFPFTAALVGRHVSVELPKPSKFSRIAIDHQVTAHSAPDLDTHLLLTFWHWAGILIFVLGCCACTSISPFLAFSLRHGLSLQATFLTELPCSFGRLARLS